MIVDVSIGFPRMKKESGERRVFLPAFIQFLARHGAKVYIEEGYGSRSGFTFDDYHCANPSVRSCSREEAFRKDHVIVLRSPLREEYALLKPGGCLISMLHFPNSTAAHSELEGAGGERNLDGQHRQ